MSSADFIAYLDTHWGVAAAVAAAMAGLTFAAGSLLHPDRRAAIGLWLAGAESEETWSKTFVSLFDAVFGARHLSLKCFVRSAIASLIAVAGIWMLMGEAGTFALRLEAELGLGAVLVIALGVNVVADYVSLLETRWLLGQMHRIRSTWAQALVLVADALVSGAIIWAAIALYVWSPLYEGEIDSFAEILGVFSIFSVAFYSTFLTSLWTWAYILTTWLMRLSAGLNLAYWVDWEKKPVAILSTMLAAVSFAATFALSIPLERDAEGLSLVDRTLCTVFKGPVCLDVQRLTPSEQARLEFLLLACEGGLTGECLRRGTAGWETAPAEAARLFRVACDGGNALGCTNLGFQHVRGLGVAADAGAAARLYRQGCDGGHAAGCTNLGVLHRHGLGVAADAGAAARLFRQGCDGGNARGCTNLGYLHEQGLGVAADAGAAARLFRQGCNGGHARGCTNLGVMHGNGHGMEADPATAVALYRRACEGDHGRGCAYLGQNLRDGIGVAVDRVAAGAAFAQACALGFEDACEWGEALAAE